MKIIYLANIRLPTEKAHGLQVMKMCESFALHDTNMRMGTNNTHKTDVTLVVPWRFNKIKQDPFEYYGVKRIFKIKKLSSLDLIPLGLSKIGFWVQSWSFVKWVFWYLLFKKTDLVYCRDFICLWALKFLRRKFIFEAHNFPGCFSLYKRTLLRAEAIIVITRHLKNKFVQQGIPAEKILVAPDGVDIEKFNIMKNQKECRQKLGLPLDKKIVLYAGHLYKWKGADVLLEAARNFQFFPPRAGSRSGGTIINFQKILFVFVGGTEKDIKNYELRVTSYELKNILIVGHRSHKEMPYWLKAADVLVLPNSAKEAISKQWTSPMKMFEYMASQQPIVASDLPSIKEVLSSRNAVLVKPDDPEVLAEGIKTALNNDALAKNISSRAYQDVQKYAWQKRARNILEFITPNF